MRLLAERFVPTLPDFLVADVRLVAAAARAGALPVLRAFVVLRALDAVFLVVLPLVAAALFVVPRLAVRAEVFEPARDAAFLAPRAVVERDVVERGVVERDVVERDEAVRLEAAFVDFAADFAGAFFAEEREVADFAAVFLAPGFAVVRAEPREVADFAAVFLAPDFTAVRAEERAEVLAADFAAVFLAALRDVVLAAVLVPAFFEAALREAAFVALFVALLAALLRAVEPVDFAADLRAVEVPDFLAPDAALFLLVEPRRALLLFPADLVLVAPASPVNSIVSGFDLSSVGIAASFKGLRVQPSRFEGNVVIPSGFRLTESVESKTSHISVDTFLSPMHSDFDAQAGVRSAIRFENQCARLKEPVFRSSVSF